MAKNPEIALSTLSAAPVSWKAAFSHTHTTETGKSTKKFVQTAETIFGSGNVHASLHLGRKINTKKLARYLKDNKITISDIDVPEVKSYLKTLWDVISEPKRAKNHMGWAITNVGSERQQRRKILQGLEATKENTLQIVRTHAAELGTKRGKRMLKTLRQYKNRTSKDVAVAIEITADRQTPTQYIDFIKEKQQELKGMGLKLLMDIDLGHIARKGYDPLKFLETVLSDKTLLEMVRFVTFNQYIHGEEEAHARLDSVGEVNFSEAAALLGKFSKQQGKNIILFETHPADFKWLISDEGGMAFFRNIKTQF